jgi:hypothetical protein
VNICLCRILVSGYELDEKDDLVASFQVNKNYKINRKCGQVDYKWILFDIP